LRTQSERPRPFSYAAAGHRRPPAIHPFFQQEGYIMHGTNHDPATSNGHGFVTGLVCGAAVGAAIGLLVAPRPGAEMRRTLVDSAGRLREQARRTYDAASERLGVVVDKGRHVADEGRHRVEDALDEARAVYNEETARGDADAG
jgi:gas vesicle protein